MKLRVGLSVFLPFAAGYFLSYLFRSINAVLAGDLEIDLDLSAAQLGLLTSMYFLAFAGFQLPLGILLDRFGPRRVEACLLMVAAAGAYVFSQGDGMLSLSLGRALIGLGVSACLMASLKAFVMWFPLERIALMNGLLLACGGLGAVVATRPTELVLDVLGWRGIFLLLACACGAVAAAIWFLVPEPPGGEGRPIASANGSGPGFSVIFANETFWRVAPLAAVSHGTAVAMQGLWAGPWLRDVAGLPRSAAANVLLLIAVAMTFGFATWGVLAGFLRRFRLSEHQVACAGLVIFMIANLMLVLQADAFAQPAWILAGFFGTAGTLFFAYLSQRFDRRMAGRVNTALNLIMFAGAFFVQWGVGIVIDLWQADDGSRYPPVAYAWAFGLALLLQIAALLWFLRPARST